MAKLRVALAQFDFPVGAVAGNAAQAGELIAQARRGGAALVAFPELTLSGYPPEDLLLRPIAPRRWLDVPLYWQHWSIRSTALAKVTDALQRAARQSLRPARAH